MAMQTGTSVNVSLQQWDLLLTINISLNGPMWVKKYVEKRLLKMILTENEVLIG